MSDPASPAPTSENTASRQSSGDTTSTALTPKYEERLIIVAQGKQFNDNVKLADTGLPQYLQGKFPSLVVNADSSMSYTDDVQHVNFTIQVVNTKSDFIAALSNSSAHVVYSGHARLGQGPCFGTGTDPGEEWGSNSADPNNTGIFRCGFPYVGLPIDEITDEHLYTVSPVSGSDPQPGSGDCHPHARAVYSQMKQFSLTDLTSKVTTDANTVAALLGGASSDATFWGYDTTGESGKFERHVLLNCGWQNTAAAPNDLGSVTMSCRAFICIGCSTYIHFYPTFRKLKGWTRDRDNNTGYAYWTTNVTLSAVMSCFWLYRILSYPQRNDFANWEPSLAYAKQMANSDYAGYGAKLPSKLI
jgi:hypothetical protein